MATIQASDVLPVRSRVSWGAILAGAVTAMAIYLLFIVAGAALGVTVLGRVEGSTLGIGAGIWVMVSLLLSLFAGGFVASRCSVGENKSEAAVYGVIVWGTVFFLMAMFTDRAINTGLNALTGASTTAAAARPAPLTEADLREAGFTTEQIDRMRTQLDRLRNRGVSEEDLQAARNNTAAAAWWFFVGLCLSMAASVGGALLGAGPNMVITSLRVRAAVVPGEPAEREIVTR